MLAVGSLCNKTSDYRKLWQDMIYVNTISLTVVNMRNSRSRCHLGRICKLLQESTW